MKVRLTSNWQDHDHLFTAGTIVDVSDRDGEMLVAGGHVEVSRDMRSTRNNVYTIGCVPTPFNTTTDTGPKAKQQTNTKKIQP